MPGNKRYSKKNNRKSNKRKDTKRRRRHRGGSPVLFLENKLTDTTNTNPRRKSKEKKSLKLKRPKTNTDSNTSTNTDSNSNSNKQPPIHLSKKLNLNQSPKAKEARELWEKILKSGKPNTDKLNKLLKPYGMTSGQLAVPQYLKLLNVIEKSGQKIGSKKILNMLKKFQGASGTEGSVHESLPTSINRLNPRGIATKSKFARSGKTKTYLITEGVNPKLLKLNKNEPIYNIISSRNPAKYATRVPTPFGPGMGSKVGKKVRHAIANQEKLPAHITGQRNNEENQIVRGDPYTGALQPSEINRAHKKANVNREMFEDTHSKKKYTPEQKQKRAKEINLNKIKSRSIIFPVPTQKKTGMRVALSAV